jgi:hypothetical protein
LVRRKRRRGLRLDEYVVERLPVKRKQYTVWDLAVEGCGVRISSTTKACVISVRIWGAKKFETLGRVSPDSPYEYLRELAIKRIGELKRERLPRAPLRQLPNGDVETLRQALENYIAAHPELSERTIEDYREILNRHLVLQMDQPISLLVATEILRLNQERLETLSKADPVNKPPIGFWAWQAALRTLRTVVGWHAAQKDRASPWPERRALRIKSASERELPVELQSVEGRRRLIEGLKAIDTPTARADRFICYTGLRRRAAASLTKIHLIANGVLEFKSKTRTLRIPLSKQAASLIDPHSQGSLLHVGDRRLRRPLIRIFGIRKTPRGKRARVTPHDLRRYFKSVGTELGIDPTIMNLLVGHTVKGVDKSYVAKLRLSVLRAAAQRISDEIENPQDPVGEDDVVVSNPGETCDGACVQCIGSYLKSDPLPSLESLKPTRHAHYLKRGDLYELVWTAPVSEIAARIGISDVGLAKACRRADIPLPSRGYWARVSAGQPIGRDPLPPTPAGLSEVIRITGTRTAPSNSRVASIRDSQATDRSDRDRQKEKAAA